VVASAPLVPRGDPTLLFTSAGMVPFKRYYVSDDPPMRRAVSIQRCLRLSDLDEVGHTPYHATFFEMLGNFSFGDYFKKEAIEWGWDFLTEVVGLPKENLWISVYKDDEAAAEIWRKHIGVPAEKVVPLGEADNFWGPAGDSGPCGPCSEIHFDMGPERGCGRPECAPGCDCDRFFEVWNLVFPQFLQHEDGTREPLRRPGIDTGMGFERLCTITQGASTIFETDVLAPIVGAVLSEVEAATGERPEGLGTEVAVIVDHARAATFAIAENILPSNEARGYVIRRLLRRAVRRGLTLGIDGPFVYRIAGSVVETMGADHPHLVPKREHIALVIKAEEDRFRETLSAGTASLEEIAQDLKAKGETIISGELAFRLYDTYGFPVDLTQEMAAEKGLSVDLTGFEAEMAKQRERGRQTSIFVGRAAGGRAWREAAGTRHGPCVFVGYEIFPERGSDVELAGGGLLAEPVEATVTRAREAAAEGQVEVSLSRTPFYAEAGGQVADTGSIEWYAGAADVRNVYREDDEIVHVLHSSGGTYPEPGTAVRARVDLARRRRIEKNHTATHLLQAALRRVLGEHVHQSGSWVGPDRLRFDFTHFAELSDDEVAAVEDIVNAYVRSDYIVEATLMKLEEAVERGAMALFEEKYAEDVRVVSILSADGTDVSVELCGGTHVARTGEIGAFAIVSEGSVAAGVRRIEAVTGADATARAREHVRLVGELSALLRTTGGELVDRARELVEENSRLRKELTRERLKSAGEAMDAVAAAAKEVVGVKVAAARTDAPDIQSLREQADRLREKLGSGAGVLGAEIGGSGVLVAVVTDDLAKSGRLRAGDLVRQVAAAMGGRGGGKPHLAQGGGDAAKLAEALASVPAVVERLLTG